MEKPIVAGLFTCSSDRLSDEEKRLFARINPLGFTLFARNIRSRKQVQALIRELREITERKDLVIAVDQEGGRVRRLTEPEFRNYAAAADLGKIDRLQPSKNRGRIFYLHAALIAQDLQDCGINCNYAPMLDLLYPQTTPALKSRLIGSVPEETAAAAEIMLETYVRNGICPCLKHMPGHGRAATDPHLGLPVIKASLDELEADFYPFRRLRRAPMGMSAHVIIPEIDAHNPITQSPMAIKELIRGRIGFEGLLVSDAIDMKALRGTYGEKTRRCLEAGCDAVCFYGADIADLHDIADNCRPLSDQSLERFEKIRRIFRNPFQELDVPALEKEYQSLTGTIEPYREEYDSTMVLQQMINNETFGE